MEVKAFAGPMTKPQALEFRKKWKTPPRKLFGTTPTQSDVSINDSFSCLTSPKTHDPGMRLQDTEKGLERVGRDLAEEYQVSWKEYWPFLDDFADLRCDEGLAMLESYLLSRIEARKIIETTDESQRRVCAKENSDKEASKPIKKKKLMANFVDKLSNAWDKMRVNEDPKLEESPDEMELLVIRMELCSLEITMDNDDSGGENDEFFTPPDTPDISYVEDYSSSDEEMFVAEEGTPVFIEGYLYIHQMNFQVKLIFTNISLFVFLLGKTPERLILQFSMLFLMLLIQIFILLFISGSMKCN